MPQLQGSCPTGVEVVGEARGRQDEAVSADLSAELVAVVTAVDDDRPLVLTSGERPRLPAGPLRSEHRSMQAGLSAWVEEQTGHRLGYVEQLYTFADGDREARRAISVSYLGLTRAVSGTQWRDWYAFFPWEDHRATESPRTSGAGLVERTVAPLLSEWVARAPRGGRSARRRRADICFGLGGRAWAPELALQRYELLWEAGLIPEAGASLVPGDPMESDHRRILATALSRLRATIQYRPVVFELVPRTFTLGRLQRTVEALAGRRLHKQNFRRLVTGQELVEETGEISPDTGGRPARLYRFRRAVLDERQVAGTKLPTPR